MRMDDDQLLSALARLDKNPDFIRFRRVYLEGLLADETQNCIETESPARHQGAAQVIQRILTDLSEAEEAFYKLTDNREVPLP